MGIDTASAPQINRDITLGSILSMATTLLATAGIVYSTGSVVAELRGKDSLHEDRIARIETRLLRQDSDHDLLIEIRRDVQRLNERLMQRSDLSPLKQLSPTQSATGPSQPDQAPTPR